MERDCELLQIVIYIWQTGNQVVVAVFVKLEMEDLRTSRGDEEGWGVWEIIIKKIEIRTRYL